MMGRLRYAGGRGRSSRLVRQPTDSGTRLR